MDKLQDDGIIIHRSTWIISDIWLICWELYDEVLPNNGLGKTTQTMNVIDAVHKDNQILKNLVYLNS